MAFKAKLHNLYGNKETVLEQFAKWREDHIAMGISIENVQWAYDSHANEFELEWLVIEV